jgi:hypothetical protein
MPGDPQLFAFALKIVLTAAIVVAAATAALANLCLVPL